MDDHALDQRLAQADPVQTGLLGRDVTEALSALREELITMTDQPIEDPASHKRRRPFRATAIVTGLVLLTGATAAAAPKIIARTGMFGQGGDNGTGEYIRLDAPDAIKAINQVGSDIPLPPGADWTSFASHFQGDPAESSESALHGDLQLVATCSWMSFWLDSHAKKDASGEQAAVAMLGTMQSWNWSHVLPEGSEQHELKVMAAAARAGDTDTIKNYHGCFGPVQMDPSANP
jgi:hypothetical protein